LKEEDDKVMIDEVRSSTRIGRRCEDDSSVGRIEGLLGRQLDVFYPAEGLSRNKWSLSLLILNICGYFGSGSNWLHRRRRDYGRKLIALCWMKKN